MEYEPLDAATVVFRVRERAQLSQRELADRARTSQSVVARIETRRTNPGVELLDRLIRSAGFRARVRLVLDDPGEHGVSHMMGDIGRILGLSPEQRLLEVANFSRFELAARRRDVD